MKGKETQVEQNEHHKARRQTKIQRECVGPVPSLTFIPDSPGSGCKASHYGPSKPCVARTRWCSRCFPFAHEMGTLFFLFVLLFGFHAPAWPSAFVSARGEVGRKRTDLPIMPSVLLYADGTLAAAAVRINQTRWLSWPGLEIDK